LFYLTYGFMTNPFKMNRLGLVMAPRANDAMEAEGVLNPGAARGPDGELYLFPRLVAKGNFSRIGIARVKFDGHGDPVGVERVGIALEPKEDYERRPGGGGGCEDARVTFVEELQHYVMTYTAFSSNGPRIALAKSKDLFHWDRLGLATFAPYHDISFNGIDNKDGSIFPVTIPDPFGGKRIALLHRPLFPGTQANETLKKSHKREHDVNIDKESIWISYCSLEMDVRKADHLGKFTSHHRLASPAEAWEILKIGVGAPPILTRHGWMLVYHGVSETASSKERKEQLRYSAGVMILSTQHPQVIKYRSPEPVLIPETPHERIGVVDDVVFPTGVDRRDDIGQPGRIDVYYGMADKCIGVARLNVPERLPRGAKIDAPKGTKRPGKIIFPGPEG
jgi:predicted GH43/DUF377 family glycosyl hydrolase